LRRNKALDPTVGRPQQASRVSVAQSFRLVIPCVNPCVEKFPKQAKIGKNGKGEIALI
jgi:hypothetical protein